jgi:hypothetical protein
MEEYLERERDEPFVFLNETQGLFYKPLTLAGKIKEPGKNFFPSGSSRGQNVPAGANGARDRMGGSTKSNTPAA